MSTKKTTLSLLALMVIGGAVWGPADWSARLGKWLTPGMTGGCGSIVRRLRPIASPAGIPPIDGGGGRPARWWWWEYEAMPDHGTEASVISVFGLHANSSFRATRIWQSMLAVMVLTGCRQQIEQLALGIDQLVRGLLDVHQGYCGYERKTRGYTLTLEVDRSLWVLTVEHAQGCCEESDRIRSLVDEPLDPAYRTFRTAFDHY